MFANHCILFLLTSVQDPDTISAAAIVSLYPAELPLSEMSHVSLRTHFTLWTRTNALSNHPLKKAP